MEKLLASDRLPSLPEVALRVVDIARQPDPDFSDLVDAIRMDPAIAGRILKTANSALLGMKTRASSIETAVPRLGTTMVRALVLGFCLAESQKSKSLALRPWYQQIWRESLIQAAAAEILAERQNGRVDPGTWFLAGLLQDIGRLAMLSACQEEYVNAVLDVNDQRTSLQREFDYFGFTHVDVGAALCRRWNLDDSIVNAVSVHHSSAHKVVPLRFVSSTSMVAGLITAAHFADYLEEVSGNLSASRESIERMLMQVFALRPNDVFRVLADVDARVGEVAAAFNVDIGNAPSLEDILADAQEVLSQIAVTSQLRLVNATISAEDEIIASRPREKNGSALASDVLLPDTVWHDPETRTFNRTYLDHALSATVQQSSEQSVPLGLMLVNVTEVASCDATDDGGCGPLCLKQVADVLKQSVRLSDAVVRFSEREFLISMFDINVDMLPLLAEQMQRRMARDVRPDKSDGATVRCTFDALFYDPAVTPRESAASLLEKIRKPCKQSNDGQITIRCVAGGRIVAAEAAKPSSSATPDLAVC